MSIRPLLDINDAANFTGYSVAHLYRMVRTGQIPARKVGRTIRFVSAELEEWVNDLPKAGT